MGDCKRGVLTYHAVEHGWFGGLVTTPGTSAVETEGQQIFAQRSEGLICGERQITLKLCIFQAILKAHFIEPYGLS